MNINDAFPSKWLKAADLEGPTVATIKLVTMDKLGDDGDDRALVYFEETTLALVLNKTNATQISLITQSPDTDAWKGKRIGLRREMVQFKGQQVEAIRVFDPTPPKVGGFGKKAAATATPPPVEEHETDDDVPPSWDETGQPIPDPGDPITGKKKK